MNPPGLPLRRGDTGAGVRDLHRRLAAAGFTDFGVPEVFDETTERALRAFQAARRLVEDGICGRQTWSALVDAHFRLGDRMLYLRAPMTRGDDIADLQLRLGNLGFDAGWLDGIFGPDTEAAVRDFQHNQGLNADGTVGRATVAALDRLAGRVVGAKTIAEVHQTEALRRNAGVEKRRILLGETGGLPAVVNSLARLLQLDGATVLTLHHPDLSSHARVANSWSGDAYVGVTLAADDFRVAYFETEGFTSNGGRLLAQRCTAKIGRVLDRDLPATGMRLPILRETRMTAVWCRVGPPPMVVERAEALATALHDAVTDWCADPHLR
ncbi:MAG: peptidoglycan-binding protein [Acidimicrobiaceae bacterium]|nr:peptidoglycan-binding protein [Acidimicrobiia bacterium]MCY4492486.1 peptidoglycan-binding protein [Acidimicrobiaceae bacterium]